MADPLLMSPLADDATAVIAEEKGKKEGLDVGETLTSRYTTMFRVDDGI